MQTLVTHWSRRHGQRVYDALGKLEAAAQRMLNFEGGDPTSSDPFAGLLPWELTTRASLRVPPVAAPAQNSGSSSSAELDLDYGAALFEFSGVCHMPTAVPPALVEECRVSAESHASLVRASVAARGIDPDGPAGFRFHEACQRGPGRYDMRMLPPRPPFDDARILGESAVWLPLVRRILGDDCSLLFQGLVVTEQGTPEQALHADGPHVPREWERHEPELAARRTAPHAQHPCHCLTVFVPLVELTAENGATAFLPGTHHSAIATAALEAEAAEAGSSSGSGTPARLMLPAGDAILFDYRLFHAGGANQSARRRPMLYLIYARPWFADTFNFPSHEEAALF